MISRKTPFWPSSKSWGAEVRRFVPLLVALIAVLASTAEAQNRPQGQNRQELERRVRQQFERRVREQLDLSQDEFTAIGAVFQEFRRARTELQLKEREVRLRMQRFVVSDGSGGDTEATAILAKLIELRERERALYVDEEQQLLEYMRPSQLVRYNQLRFEFAKRVQRLRQGNLPGRLNGFPEFLDPGR